MSTSTMYRMAGANTRDTRQTTFDRMEAIACGVQARFEESTGYSRKVTDTTINVARSLGVSDDEIKRWASNRFSRIAQETEKFKEIKSHLEKLYGNSGLKRIKIKQ
jgi:hypothetical protein